MMKDTTMIGGKNELNENVLENAAGGTYAHTKNATHERNRKDAQEAAAREFGGVRKTDPNRQRPVNSCNFSREKQDQLEKQLEQHKILFTI